MWIYVSWVIVLLGAVFAAYLPSLLAGVARRGGAHGWHFQLAIEVLQQLHAAGTTAPRGLTASQLAMRLQVDALQLEPVFDALRGLDWVGQISEALGDVESRYVLLAAPDTTPLEPLMDRLLLGKTPSVDALWHNARLSSLKLRDAL